MNLAVLTYQYADNPKSIPSAWPANIIELGSDTNLPGANWILMTTLEYSSYISQHLSEYNAWLAANPPQSGDIVKDPSSSEIVYTNTITTTSASDVLMTNLSITPITGTYAATFYGSFSVSNAGKIIYMSFYKAGSQITGTEVQTRLATSTTSVTSIAKTITFSGSELLEVRWRVNGNTATCYNRTLTIYRVGD